MKKLSTSFFALLLMGNIAIAQNFTLKSNDLGGQATIKEFYNSFGCTGQNISPQLSWTGVPRGTQSFAVTIHDKDAPTGSGFWHWVVFNIPADVTELKSGAGDVSKALAPKECIQSITDFGTTGYGGPCPPPGAPHEYLITVYALKTKLDLEKSASPALVGFNLNANALAKASIVMYGQR